MNSHIHIRPYEEKDYHTLCLIHDPSRMQELEYAGVPDAFLPMTIAAEREELFGYQIYLAEWDGVPAGFVAFSADELAWLYVDVRMMRRGIGSALVSFALERMERDVTIEVLAGNTPAIATYEKAGFTIEKTISGVMTGNETFKVTGHIMKRK